MDLLLVDLDFDEVVVNLHFRGGDLMTEQQLLRRRSADERWQPIAVLLALLFAGFLLFRHF